MSEFDVFLADCPARTTLALVGDAWSVVVITALGERPRRYSELLERIGGISKKMLTQPLRKLERNGLIERAGGVYQLTALGLSLLGVVRALAEWAERNTAALLDAGGAA
ncbi:MAG: winged helix-turn-helix transcriptional regulator [Pseudonocardiaceae bacterium]